MARYKRRDAEAQGEHYQRHISALTAEDLHSKSDIAAELAHRDKALATIKEYISEIDCKDSKNQAFVKMSCELVDEAIGFDDTQEISPLSLEDAVIEVGFDDLQDYNNISYCTTRRHVSGFRIFANITHNNNFIYASSCHYNILFI